MARPRFTPTADQRRTLDALAKAAKQRDAAEERIEQLIAQAGAEDIPVKVIAETAGIMRKTVYRRLGREM